MSEIATTLVPLLVGIGFGASLAALAVTYSLIHSTLASAPPKGAGKGHHLFVIAVRLLFFAFAVTSIALARPLRLAIGESLIPPLLAIVVLVVVLVVGMKHILPKVIRVRLTTEP